MPVGVGLDGREDFVETLAFGGELLLVFRDFGLALFILFFADFKDA